MTSTAARCDRIIAMIDACLAAIEAGAQPSALVPGQPVAFPARSSSSAVLPAA
jgi:hypothetical protein